MKAFAIAFAVVASCQLAPLEVKADPLVIDPLNIDGIVIAPAGFTYDADGNAEMSVNGTYVTRDVEGGDKGTYVGVDLNGDGEFDREGGSLVGGGNTSSASSFSGDGPHGNSGTSRH